MKSIEDAEKEVKKHKLDKAYIIKVNQNRSLQGTIISIETLVNLASL
jgi:ABC-2 type transport system permease protein